MKPESRRVSVDKIQTSKEKNKFIKVQITFYIDTQLTLFSTFILAPFVDNLNFHRM